MLSKQVFSILFLSVVLLSGTSRFAAAQTEPLKLSLELSKSQESYLIAEPFSFNLKLSNLTNQPVSWKGSLSSSPLVFLVTNAAGVQTRFDESNRITGYTYIPLNVMQPQGQVQESSLLERDLVEEFFPSPGQYQLQVEFSYGENESSEERIKILSNSISIDILEPQGINRQAYQFIKETLDTADRNSKPRVLAELKQQFVNRYRNSVYAKYIIFSLGNTYQTTGEEAKALRELCKISGENFHHSQAVEKIVRRLGAKLNPVVWNPNAPPPIVRHPCTGKILN